MSAEFKELYDAIRSGTLENVKELIARGEDVNQIGNVFSGGTLVHAAVERGDAEILKLLIVHGADVAKADFDTNTTPLQSAVIADRHDLAEIIREALERRKLGGVR